MDSFPHDTLQSLGISGSNSGGSAQEQALKLARSMHSCLTSLSQSSAATLPAFSPSDEFAPLGLSMQGRVIKGMVAGGIAEANGGFQPGDVIVSVDGVEADDENVTSLLRGKPVDAGKPCLVAIIRGPSLDSPTMSITLMRGSEAESQSRVQSSIASIQRKIEALSHLVGRLSSEKAQTVKTLGLITLMLSGSTAVPGSGGGGDAGASALLASLDADVVALGASLELLVAEVRVVRESVRRGQEEREAKERGVVRWDVEAQGGDEYEGNGVLIKRLEDEIVEAKVREHKDKEATKALKAEAASWRENARRGDEKAAELEQQVASLKREMDEAGSRYKVDVGKLEAQYEQQVASLTRELADAGSRFDVDVGRMRGRERDWMERVSMGEAHALGGLEVSVGAIERDIHMVRRGIESERNSMKERVRKCQRAVEVERERGERLQQQLELERERGRHFHQQLDVERERGRQQQQQLEEGSRLEIERERGGHSHQQQLELEKEELQRQLNVEKEKVEQLQQQIGVSWETVLALKRELEASRDANRATMHDLDQSREQVMRLEEAAVRVSSPASSSSGRMGEGSVALREGAGPGRARIEALESELAVSRKDVVRLEEELAVSRDAVYRLEGKHAELEGKIRDRDEASREALFEVEVQLEKAKKEASVSRDAILWLKSELASARSEAEHTRDELIEQVASLERQLLMSKSREDISVLQAEYDGLVTKLQEDLQVSRDAVSKLEDEAARYKAEADKLERQLSIQEALHSDRQGDVSAIKEAVSKLEGDLEVSRDAVSRLERDLAVSREAADKWEGQARMLGNKVVMGDADARSLTDKLRERDAEVFTLKERVREGDAKSSERIRGLDAEVSSLKAEVRLLEGQARELREQEELSNSMTAVLASQKDKEMQFAMERLEREVTRAELEVVRAADDADRLRSDMEEVLRVAEGRRKDLDASKIGLLNSQRRERRLQVRHPTLNPRLPAQLPQKGLEIKGDCWCD